MTNALVGAEPWLGQPRHVRLGEMPAMISPELKIQLMPPME